MAKRAADSCSHRGASIGEPVARPRLAAARPRLAAAASVGDGQPIGDPHDLGGSGVDPCFGRQVSFRLGAGHGDDVFCVDALLGDGKFGQVYSIHLVAAGAGEEAVERFALKVYKRARDDRELRNIEALLAAQERHPAWHPNVVRFHRCTGNPVQLLGGGAAEWNAPHGSCILELLMAPLVQPLQVEKNLWWRFLESLLERLLEGRTCFRCSPQLQQRPALACHCGCA